MQFDLEVLAKLLAPIIAALVGAIIKHYFEAKPKLISYLVHASAIPLNDGNSQIINTHSIVVRNAGKKTANNIRIGHNTLPKSFQIYPPVSYTILSVANVSSEILIPTLVPNEQITISYLYFPPLTFNQVHAYTKSDEVLAQIINVIPTPQPAKLAIWGIWALIFVGASTICYWTIMYIAKMLLPSF